MNVYLQNMIYEQKPDPGDYEKDGILYCGQCGTPRQHKVWPRGSMGDYVVVPIECRCRKERTYDRQASEARAKEAKWKENRIRTSGLTQHQLNMTFDAWAPELRKEKPYRVAARYVTNWATVCAKNSWLLLYGDVGTGKTYMAAAIANALLQDGKTVRMTSFVEILKDIQSDDINEAEYIEEYIKKPDLLVLDDLGAERSTDYACEKVFGVIDARYQLRKPTIITTNLDVAELFNTSDIRYRRIYDRIGEFAFPLRFKGRSLRRPQEAS